MAKSRKSTTITGACGEHYIAAYLSGFELLVAMPRAGIPGSDLFVAKEKGGHAVRIQVKTGTQATKKDIREGPIYLWQTSEKVIERNDGFLWYAFVWLNGWPHEERLPEIFFVPSSEVVKCVAGCRDAKEWLCFWMRKDDAEKYRGRSGLQLLLNALGS